MKNLKLKSENRNIKKVAVRSMKISMMILSILVLAWCTQHGVDSLEINKVEMKPNMMSITAITKKDSQISSLKNKFSVFIKSNLDLKTHYYLNFEIDKNDVEILHDKITIDRNKRAVNVPIKTGENIFYFIDNSKALGNTNVKIKLIGQYEENGKRTKMTLQDTKEIKLNTIKGVVSKTIKYDNKVTFDDENKIVYDVNNLVNYNNDEKINLQYDSSNEDIILLSFEIEDKTPYESQQLDEINNVLTINDANGYFLITDKNNKEFDSKGISLNSYKNTRDDNKYTVDLVIKKKPLATIPNGTYNIEYSIKNKVEYYKSIEGVVKIQIERRVIDYNKIIKINNEEYVYNDNIVAHNMFINEDLNITIRLLDVLPDSENILEIDDVSIFGSDFNILNTEEPTFNTNNNYTAILNLKAKQSTNENKFLEFRIKDKKGNYKALTSKIKYKINKNIYTPIIKLDDKAYVYGASLSTKDYFINDELVLDISLSELKSEFKNYVELNPNDEFRKFVEIISLSTNSDKPNRYEFLNSKLSLRMKVKKESNGNLLIPFKIKNLGGEYDDFDSKIKINIKKNNFDYTVKINGNNYEYIENIDPNSFYINDAFTMLIELNPNIKDRNNIIEFSEDADFYNYLTVINNTNNSKIFAFDEQNKVLINFMANSFTQESIKEIDFKIKNTKSVFEDINSKVKYRIDKRKFDVSTNIDDVVFNYNDNNALVSKKISEQIKIEINVKEKDKENSNNLSSTIVKLERSSLGNNLEIIGNMDEYNLIDGKATILLNAINRTNNANNKLEFTVENSAFEILRLPINYKIEKQDLDLVTKIEQNVNNYLYTPEINPIIKNVGGVLSVKFEINNNLGDTKLKFDNDADLWSYLKVYESNDETINVNSREFQFKKIGVKKAELILTFKGIKATEGNKLITYNIINEKFNTLENHNIKYKIGKLEYNTDGIKLKKNEKDSNQFVVGDNLNLALVFNELKDKNNNNNFHIKNWNEVGKYLSISDFNIDLSLKQKLDIRSVNFKAIKPTINNNGNIEQKTITIEFSDSTKDDINTSAGIYETKTIDIPFSIKSRGFDAILTLSGGTGTENDHFITGTEVNPNPSSSKIKLTINKSNGNIDDIENYKIKIERDSGGSIGIDDIIKFKKTNGIKEEIELGDEYALNSSDFYKSDNTFSIGFSINSQSLNGNKLYSFKITVLHNEDSSIKQIVRDVIFIDSFILSLSFDNINDKLKKHKLYRAVRKDVQLKINSENTNIPVDKQLFKFEVQPFNIKDYFDISFDKGTKKLSVTLKREYSLNTLPTIKIQAYHKEHPNTPLSNIDNNVVVEFSETEPKLAIKQYSEQEKNEYSPYSDTRYLNVQYYGGKIRWIVDSENVRNIYNPVYEIKYELLDDGNNTIGYDPNKYLITSNKQLTPDSNNEVYIDFQHIELKTIKKAKIKVVITEKTTGYSSTQYVMTRNNDNYIVEDYKDKIISQDIYKIKKGLREYNLYDESGEAIYNNGYDIYDNTEYELYVQAIDLMDNTILNKKSNPKLFPKYSYKIEEVGTENNIVFDSTQPKFYDYSGSKFQRFKFNVRAVTEEKTIQIKTIIKEQYTGATVEKIHKFIAKPNRLKISNFRINSNERVTATGILDNVLKLELTDTYLTSFEGMKMRVTGYIENLTLPDDNINDLGKFVSNRNFKFLNKNTTAGYLRVINNGESDNNEEITFDRLNYFTSTTQKHRLNSNDNVSYFNVENGKIKKILIGYKYENGTITNRVKFKIDIYKVISEKKVFEQSFTTTPIDVKQQITIKEPRLRFITTANSLIGKQITFKLADSELGDLDDIKIKIIPYLNDKNDESLNQKFDFFKGGSSSFEVLKTSTAIRGNEFVDFKSLFSMSTTTENIINRLSSSDVLFWVYYNIEKKIYGNLKCKVVIEKGDIFSYASEFTNEEDIEEALQISDVRILSKEGSFVTERTVNDMNDFHKIAFTLSNVALNDINNMQIKVTPKINENENSDILMYLSDSGVNLANVISSKNGGGKGKERQDVVNLKLGNVLFSDANNFSNGSYYIYFKNKENNINDLSGNLKFDIEIFKSGFYGNKYRKATTTTGLNIVEKIELSKPSFSPSNSTQDNIYKIGRLKAGNVFFSFNKLDINKINSFNNLWIKVNVYHNNQLGNTKFEVMKDSNQMGRLSSISDYQEGTWKRINEFKYGNRQITSSDLNTSNYYINYDFKNNIPQKGSVAFEIQIGKGEAQNSIVVMDVKRTDDLYIKDNINISSVSVRSIFHSNDINNRLIKVNLSEIGIKDFDTAEIRITAYDGSSKITSNERFKYYKRTFSSPQKSFIVKSNNGEVLNNAWVRMSELSIYSNNSNKVINYNSFLSGTHYIPYKYYQSSMSYSSLSFLIEIRYKQNDNSGYVTISRKSNMISGIERLQTKVEIENNSRVIIKYEVFKSRHNPTDRNFNCWGRIISPYGTGFCRRALEWVRINRLEINLVYKSNHYRYSKLGVYLPEYNKPSYGGWQASGDIFVYPSNINSPTLNSKHFSLIEYFGNNGSGLNTGNYGITLNSNINRKTTFGVYDETPGNVWQNTRYRMSSGIKTKVSARYFTVIYNNDYSINW